MAGQKPHRYTPDNPRVTFRFDDGSDNPPAFDANLVEFVATTTESGGRLTGISIIFECDAAAYAAIEGNSWFRLRPNLADDLGRVFDKSLPVRIEAAMDELSIETSFFTEFQAGNEKEALAELVAPLYDKEVFGMTRSPVAYEFTRVSQTATNTGFTFANAASAPPKIGEAVITSAIFQAREQVIGTEPESAVYFSGVVNVSGVLKQIRVRDNDDGPHTLEIKVEFDAPTFGKILGNGLFGVTPELTENLVPARSVEGLFELAPNLFEPCLRKAGSNVKALITVTAADLANPRAVSPCVSSASWVCRLLVQ